MANGGNFLRGAVVGSCIAVFALGIGAKALGQPINLQEVTAEGARSDNRSERAEVANQQIETEPLKGYWSQRLRHHQRNRQRPL